MEFSRKCRKSLLPFSKVGEMVENQAACVGTMGRNRERYSLCIVSFTHTKDQNLNAVKIGNTKAMHWLYADANDIQISFPRLHRGQSSEKVAQLFTARGFLQRYSKSNLISLLPSLQMKWAYFEHSQVWDFGLDYFDSRLRYAFSCSLNSSIDLAMRSNHLRSPQPHRPQYRP
jgi:hypothetical protein